MDMGPRPPRNSHDIALAAALGGGDDEPAIDATGEFQVGTLAARDARAVGRNKSNNRRVS